MTKQYIALKEYVDETGVFDNKEAHERNLNAVIESDRLKNWADTGCFIDDAYDFRIAAFYADMSVPGLSLVQLKLMHLAMSEAIYLHRNFVAISKSTLSAFLGTNYSRIKDSFSSMVGISPIYNVLNIDNRVHDSSKLPNVEVLQSINENARYVEFVFSPDFFDAVMQLSDDKLYATLNLWTIKRLNSVYALAAYPAVSFYSMIATDGFKRSFTDIRFRTLLSIDSRDRKKAVSQSEFKLVILPKVFSMISETDGFINVDYVYNEETGKIITSFFQSGQGLIE